MAHSKAEQYSYCSVCRRNHDEGRKHIFSKQHKNRLQILLSKFSKKVHSARRVLHKPVVCEGELEPGRGGRMWCYCCGEEVGKHVTDGTTSVEWGGLLEHMASPIHHKKTRHFWWENGAEKNQLQTYLIFPAEYQRFKNLVADALKILEAKREKRVKKVAEDLRAKERLQSLAALEPPPTPSPPTPSYRTVKNQHGVVQNPTGWHEGQRVWGGGIVRYKPGSDQLLPWAVDSIDRSFLPTAKASSSVRVTAAAFGEGLTSIGAQSLSQGEGNIHSGAMPPWMQGDSDSEEDDHTPSASIGPSLEDFLKHKEKLKQAGKNPRRVGADFHRKLAQQKDQGDADWLPNFGRVWNYGPRFHSVMEFRRELEDEKKKTLLQRLQPPSNRSPSVSGVATVSTTPVQQQQQSGTMVQETADVNTSGSKLPQIRPYVRKRPQKRVHSQIQS